MQRKHEGLERDLAALGQKIQNMDEAAAKLGKNHPEALKEITERKAEITKDWKQLNSVATARKEKLLDSYDFQRFLSDFRDLMAWIANMKSLINNEEMATDVTVAEALLERHQEHRTEIGKKSQWLKISKKSHFLHLCHFSSFMGEKATKIFFHQFLLFLARKFKDNFVIFR